MCCGVLMCLDTDFCRAKTSVEHSALADSASHSEMSDSDEVEHEDMPDSPE